MINNDLQLKEILIEGYLDEMCYIERLLKSPNSKEVRLKGGLDRLSKKLRYIKNRLLEVRPPRFPETLYRKIIRRYRDPIKAYKVMWSLHNKHRDKLDEMWLAFEGNINESLNSDNNCGLPLIKRGFIGESPDSISIGKTSLVWTAEDARPFVIFDGILVLRDYSTTHSGMNRTLLQFGSELKFGYTNPTEVKFGTKMSIYYKEAGRNETFYFSQVPDANWFINLYDSRKPMLGLKTEASGRIWLDSNVVSFWGGCNTANVKLLMKTLKNMRHNPRV